MAVIEDVRSYLEQVRDLMAAAKGASTALYDLMLEHGRYYAPAPLPADVEEGTPGDCFRDASTLSLNRPDLIYVEGWATSGILPVEHAWCVTESGFVIDPTWAAIGDDDWERREYFGIPIKYHWHRQMILARTYFGVFHPGPPDWIPPVLGEPPENWVHGLRAESPS